MPAETGTRGFHDRMAVVFDFDLTLAPGTVPWLLRCMGVPDPERWEREHCDPMVRDGWDQILAYGPLLARAARERGIDLTRDVVEQAGRSLPIYDGVEATLAALRELGREASEGATVELYVLSSGFVEIMGASQIAHCFDAMWGSALYWDERGHLAGVKRSVIHAEKALYLLALAKGLDMTGANEPQDVHTDKPMTEWHVPLDQMIYVGDGESDIAAFHLMHGNGGVAIGVDHSESGDEWARQAHVYDAARVDNLAPVGFSEGDELARSLRLAVESVGKRIALRRFAQRRRES